MPTTFLKADNIVIASPIYFGELTGSLLSLMSRSQYLWVARKFRNTEPLSPKKRNGVLLLVDGGEGVMDAAMTMGKCLLRKMHTEFIGSVYFSGTENVPKSDTVVPKRPIIFMSSIPANGTKDFCSEIT